MTKRLQRKYNYVAHIMPMKNRQQNFATLEDGLPSSGDNSGKLILMRPFYRRHSLSYRYQLHQWRPEDNWKDHQ